MQDKIELDLENAQLESSKSAQSAVHDMVLATVIERASEVYT